MSGILRLESLTKGNTLKQGDKTPLKYKLFDADGDTLNIAGKTAKVRLVYPDFLTIGYEKDGLTVAQDDTVTFTIDRVIPSRIYHVEIIVDDKFIFPSRADESKFTVDKSSLGADANIIEIVGKDVLIQAVKSQVDTELQPLVTSLESAEQAETQRESAESSRVSAEEQRQTDHANRSAELDGKADKVVLSNLVENGSFNNEGQGWVAESNIPKITFGDNYVEFEGGGRYTSTSYNWVHHPPSVIPDDNDVLYTHALVTRISGNGDVSIGSGYRGAYTSSLPLNEKTPLSFRGVQNTAPSSINRNFVISAGVGILVRYESPIYLNLTKIFGVGNEPSKEEMDRLIETTGFIDGEYTLSNKEMISYLMDGKANKKQADWIIPTLLNGVTGNLRFRFTETGKIDFIGGIKLVEPASPSIVICSLPANLLPRSNDSIGNVNWIIGFPIVSSTLGGERAAIVKAEVDTYDRLIRLRSTGNETDFEFNTTVNLN